MRRIALLILSVLCCMGQSASVEKPSFLRTHSIWSARDEMFIQVRIVPHKDIRTVALEAWELEREPVEPDENGTVSEFSLPMNPKRVGDSPIRRSREDAVPRQAIYRFTWRGLDVGDYSLVAVVATATTTKTAAQTILVR